MVGKQTAPANSRPEQTIPDQINPRQQEQQPETATAAHKTFGQSARATAALSQLTSAASLGRSGTNDVSHATGKYFVSHHCGRRKHQPRNRRWQLLG
jgi:hypothetical protein